MGNKSMEFKPLEVAFEDENPESIFEVGCANGSILLALKEKYPNVKLGGMDINQKDIEIIKKRTDGYFIHWDANDRWRIESKSWDIVFTYSMLTLLKDIDPVLDQMLRVGKKVILVEPPDKRYETKGLHFIQVYNGRGIYK